MTEEEVHVRLDVLALKIATLGAIGKETDNEYLMKQVILFNEQMKCALCMAKQSRELFNTVEKKVDIIFNQMN